MAAERMVFVGGQDPMKVRWSSPGDVTDWTPQIVSVEELHRTPVRLRGSVSPTAADQAAFLNAGLRRARRNLKRAKVAG